MTVKIVKELSFSDGIGAQLLRKIYAMSYAYEMSYLFEDTPIKDFFNHPSDNIKIETEKKIFIDNFSSLINNPWKNINFNNIKNKYYLTFDDYLNIENPLNPTLTNFIKNSNKFSNIKYKDNSNIVLHTRRGNVTKENPRWIEEDEYLSMIDNIPKILNKLNIINPKIIILTDSSETDTVEIPENELDYWRQQYLIENRIYDGTSNTITNKFKMSRINESIFNNLPYETIILKNYDTFKSFLLMCNANVLFTNRSAFSISASYLSKSNIIDYGFKSNKVDRLNTAIGFFEPSQKEVFFYN